jgi:hypothetical protein
LRRKTRSTIPKVYQATPQTRNPDPMKTWNTSIYFPDAGVIRRLRTVARKRKIPVSTFIRDAAVRALEREERKLEQEEKKQRAA